MIIDNNGVKSKRCPKCEEIKSIAMFSHNATRKDGFDCHCKECINKNTKEYHEKIKAQNQNKDYSKIILSDISKICIKCNELKSLEMFKINRGTKDGFSNICRTCASKKYKENTESMTDERIGEIELMKPIKHCIGCKMDKPIINFGIDRSNFDGHRSVCNECYSQRSIGYYGNRIDYLKEYRDNHKIKYSNYHKEKGENLKIEVLTHYGNGKCTCVICGENRLPCLSIDHINGGGGQHRKSLGKYGYSGVRFYKWLKDNNFPSGFRTLCMNDQFLVEHEKRNYKLPIDKAETV